MINYGAFKSGGKLIMLCLITRSLDKMVDLVI